MGLKHNYELKNNIKPSEAKGTVEKIYETRQEEEARKDRERAFQQMMNEYLGN